MKVTAQWNIIYGVTHSKDSYTLHIKNGSKSNTNSQLQSQFSQITMQSPHGVPHGLHTSWCASRPAHLIMYLSIRLARAPLEIW